MNAKTERMQILEMINSGRLSVEQGLALLRAVGDEDEQQTPDDGLLDADNEQQTTRAGLLPPDSLPLPASAGSSLSSDSPETPEPPSSVVDGLSSNPFRWRRWWALPLLVGAGLALWGGMFMSLAYWARGGFNLWVLCASVPVGLGLLVMVLAWMSRTAPWLHLRVQQKPGSRPERFALSFPLPIGPVRWLLRTFDWRMPDIQGVPVEDMLEMVGRSATPESPLYINVNDEEDGEKVEIYIG